MGDLGPASDWRPHRPFGLINAAWMGIIRKGRVPLLSLSRDTFLLLFQTNWPGATGMVYAHCLLHPMVALPNYSNLPERRHHPLPAKLCLLTGGRIYHLHWNMHEDQQCPSQNSHPRESLEKRFPSFYPRSRYSLFKKSFATELLHQKE